MKSKQLPRLFEEGLKHIAGLGFNQVYEDILDEYGEKLKQDFISQMTKKLEVYISVHTEPVLEDMGFTVKIELDIKGIELP